MKNDVNLLEILMNDLQHQAGIHRPGPYWHRSALAAAREMKRSGIENFRSPWSGVIGQGYSDNMPLDPSINWKQGSLPRKLLGWALHISPLKKYITDEFVRYIAFMRKELVRYKSYFVNKELGEKMADLMDDAGVPDTLLGGCEDYALVCGRKVSFHYIETLVRIWNFDQEVDFSKVHSVLEIGGGFGANAHLLLHLYPNIRKYVYLDIPPYLYVGTQYLKHFFPGAVKDYRATRGQEEIRFAVDEDREIIAIPPWKLDSLKEKIDCFWNSASFQEMTEQIVSNYRDQIGRLAHRGRKTSHICLLMYPNYDPERTLSPSRITELFSESFVMHGMHPRFVSGPGNENIYVHGRAQTISPDVIESKTFQGEAHV